MSTYKYKLYVAITLHYHIPSLLHTTIQTYLSRLVLCVACVHRRPCPATRSIPSLHRTQSKTTTKRLQAFIPDKRTNQHGPYIAAYLASAINPLRLQSINRIHNQSLYVCEQIEEGIERTIPSRIPILLGDSTYVLFMCTYALLPTTTQSCYMAQMYQCDSSMMYTYMIQPYISMYPIDYPIDIRICVSIYIRVR